MNETKFKYEGVTFIVYWDGVFVFHCCTDLNGNEVSNPDIIDAAYDVLAIMETDHDDEYSHPYQIIGE